jgi:hypothetical protein
VRSRNGQRTSAHKISNSAEHLQVRGGVVRDSAAVLEVLGVSKEHGTDDLGAPAGVEVADGGGGEGGALAVGC